MLSNVGIKNYIESKDIIIDPWDDEIMGAARITLHLGEKILIPKGNQIIDVKKNILPDYDEILLTDEKPFALEPGQFVLSETFEEIGLSEKIGMLLEGRSTFARLGIMVVQTAMIIDSGQKPRRITLEIRNNSAQTFLLYPKLKFCRACFFLLEPPASMRYDTDGKYQQGDSNKPVFTDEFRGK